MDGFPSIFLVVFLVLAIAQSSVQADDVAALNPQFPPKPRFELLPWDLGAPSEEFPGWIQFSPVPENLFAPSQTERASPKRDSSRKLSLFENERLSDETFGTTSSLVDLSRILRWTLVVCVLGGVATYFLLKHSRGVSLAPLPRDMKVLETVSLGPRGSVHLIRVGDDHFLAATDASGIRSLTLIPNWPLPDGGLAASPDAEQPMSPVDIPSSQPLLAKAA
ncbi:MAG: flagellar biosynthetic protein FliO [Planctomycetaceae bacterium]|nr:flagellar biosynthetic protein FliO [Planctomycetaceae bacterium]